MLLKVRSWEGFRVQVSEAPPLEVRNANVANARTGAGKMTALTLRDSRNLDDTALGVYTQRLALVLPTILVSLNTYRCGNVNI